MNAVNHLPRDRFDLVNAQEPGLDHPGHIVTELQGAGQAVPPLLNVVVQVVGHRLVRHDVRDREPPARSQHSEHLAKNLPLVRGQVDHAVRDDQIDAAILDGHRLHHPFAELGVGGGVPEVRRDDRRVAPRDRQHLVGHVNPDHPACRAHPARSLEAVDPSAGPDVQHCLARSNSVQPGRGPTAVGDLQNFLGNEGPQILDVVAGRAADLFAGRGGSRIPFTHGLGDGFVRHPGSSRSDRRMEMLPCIKFGFSTSSAFVTVGSEPVSWLPRPVSRDRQNPARPVVLSHAQSLQVLSPPAPDPSIAGDIDSQDHHTQDELHLSGEGCGVE